MITQSQIDAAYAVFWSRGDMVTKENVRAALEAAQASAGEESHQTSTSGQVGRAAADPERALTAAARFIEQAAALGNLPIISKEEGLAMREGLPTPNDKS